MKYLKGLVYTFLLLLVLTSCKDSDEDGVVDYKDNCQDTPIGELVNENGCPLPQPPPNCEEEGIVFSKTKVIFRFPKEDVERLKDLAPYNNIDGFGIILKKYYNSDSDDFTLDDLIESIKNIEFCACGDLSPILVTLDPTFGIETKLDNLKKDTAEGGVEGDLNFSFNLLPNETPNEISEFTINPPPLLEVFKKIKPDFISQSNNVIAVLDTGIDLLGQYSTDNTVTEAKKLIYQYNDVSGSENCLLKYGGSGWNFVDNNSNFYDDNEGIGHGTLVTKTLTNELDLLGIVDYSILPLKVFDNKGKGSYWKINCAMAYLNEIQEKTQNLDGKGDIKLINASFGGSFDLLTVDDLGVMKSFIDSLENSALFVTSAGNCGENTDTAISHFPSGYTSKNIVSVGGYKRGENSSLKKDISSNFGKESIDVAAPFTLNELAVIILGSGAGSAKVEGTSYSTPLVSAKLFEILLKNPGAIPAKVIQEFYEQPNTEQDGNLDNFFKESGFYEPKQN